MYVDFRSIDFRLFLFTRISRVFEFSSYKSFPSSFSLSLFLSSSHLCISLFLFIFFPNSLFERLKLSLSFNLFKANSRSLRSSQRRIQSFNNLPQDLQTFNLSLSFIIMVLNTVAKITVSFLTLALRVAAMGGNPIAAPQQQVYQSCRGSGSGCKCSSCYIINWDGSSEYGFSNDSQSATPPLSGPSPAEWKPKVQSQQQLSQESPQESSVASNDVSCFRLEGKGICEIVREVKS